MNPTGRLIRPKKKAIRGKTGKTIDHGLAEMLPTP